MQLFVPIPEHFHDPKKIQEFTCMWQVPEHTFSIIPQNYVNPPVLVHDLEPRGLDHLNIHLNILLSLGPYDTVDSVVARVWL